MTANQSPVVEATPNPSFRRVARSDTARNLHANQASTPQPAGVYFFACIDSLFGSDQRGKGVTAALDLLCRAAGVTLVEPHGIEKLCCGTIWMSKGFTAGQHVMTEKVTAALWEASEHGRLPVVCGASSCSLELSKLAEHLPEGTAAREHAEALKVMDSITFARQMLAPRLTIKNKLESVVVHPTCSNQKMGTVDDLIAVAQLFADIVYVPPTYGCCGFAGDRGMLHPELTRAATRPEADAVIAAEQSGQAHRDGQPGRFSAYVSDNRTCELGMRAGTDRPYRHILEALADQITTEQ